MSQEDAIVAVRGIDSEPNEFMIRGAEAHEKFEVETKKTGKTPAIFKADIAVKQTEQRKTHQFEDWWVLSGVADAITDESVIDYKTSGSRSAGDFLKSGQLEIYAFLFKKKIGEIMCLNWKTGEVTRARKHISKQRMTDVLEDVGNVAHEIKAAMELASIPWWRPCKKCKRQCEDCLRCAECGCNGGCR